ncbi:unnamed protein product [Leptosia nina]|uniref:Actin maturation protease n=1 Tax=Leptosia nina TaxID=320188 RepID=A0AAV1JM60_9NEOP
MCTNPPVPPPLPSLDLINSSEISKTTSLINKNYDICQWALEPELREACAINSICLDKPPYQYKYKHYEPIAQVGPTCGLVALAMLFKGDVRPDELLNMVKAEGFSSNGEMFSCHNMAKLTEKVICLTEKSNVRVEVRQELYREETIQELLNGAALLVAYDADCNHSPCLRHGHTAHWALVCGIIVIEEPKEDYSADPNNTYILCRHGKSKYLAVWPLAQLDSSNKNLSEFSPKKKEDGLLYILPDGGMGGERGLRNQFLIVKGL